MCGGQTVVPRRDLLHFEHLTRCDSITHVPKGTANADRAVLQTLVDDLEDLVALLQVRALEAPAAFFSGLQKGDRASLVDLVAHYPVDHHRACLLVAGGDAIVRLGLAGARFIPTVEEVPCTADFEIHAAGQAVAQPDGIAERRLPVEVRVNEPRPHDMASGIHRLGTFQWLFAYRDDAAVFDADIGDIVEQRFRVHDPAVVDDEVVVLGKGRRNGEKTCRQEYADAGRNIHGVDGLVFWW